jgi:hypothetical protein
MNPNGCRRCWNLLTGSRVVPGVRCALEVRDKRWQNDDCFEQLRAHNWSLVLADKPGQTAEGPVTAEFVFMRRHGPGGDHGANYTEEMLQGRCKTRPRLFGGRTRCVSYISITMSVVMPLPMHCAFENCWHKLRFYCGSFK